MIIFLCKLYKNLYKSLCILPIDTDRKMWHNRRVLDDSPDPFSRSYTPYAKFLLLLATFFTLVIFPKSRPHTLYAHQMSWTARRRSARAVFPIGPTICEFFPASSDLLNESNFPGTHPADRFSSICNLFLCKADWLNGKRQKLETLPITFALS